MNTRTRAAALGLSLLCAFVSSHSYAGQALDEVNAEVAQKSEEIDQKFGVLLTTSERSNLKIRLIVDRLVAQQAEQPEVTVKSLVDDAIATYEISDPTDQRQLLIETQSASMTGNGSGNRPPCCG